MTLVNIPITLDWQSPLLNPIKLQQGEKDSRTLTFKLASSGVAIDLTACTILFCATKPSGAIIGNACTIVSAAAGKVAYVVTEQTAIESGTFTDARLEIVKAGETLYTMPFPVIVSATPDYSAAVESASEFTVFETAMGDLALKATDSLVVHLAGAETITGLKSVPTPTADAHIARKDYVDQNINFASPVGEIKMWPTSVAPTKYLICNGAAISRTTYAALFALLSTTYGSGDGSTTFNLPNLKGKIPVGFDAAQPEFDALGETGGAKTVTLSANESGVPAHTHPASIFGDVAGTVGHVTVQGVSNAVNYASIPNIVSANTAAAAVSAHTNLQPYITLNYIIRALA